ncbi:hypothetical protein J7I93_22025 [Bacillus sp. ISL-47]|uniref:hypothetical protein n=1 Tax=Bacillus sp. ISL-47 TaxID=2819130 RepID=UPI001BEA8BAA|nr:hypothetical protein [Bacillus sp. ISL-47]MBT2690822.1 hypothetical protein [Bacillus sp. ISL-47]MBT2710823.1 hypothetical protein [Pseudomonas sp. ISL-84]
MKLFKYLIVFIGIFSIFIVGCSNESSNKLQNEGNKILVEKRVGEENKYEHYKEITDDSTVRKAKDILKNISWENAEVSMAYPPHYKFHFVADNEQSGLIYDLWISPNKDKVELVIEGEGKYVQLNKSKSAQLFETIIGVKLSEVE